MYLLEQILFVLPFIIFAGIIVMLMYTLRNHDIIVLLPWAMTVVFLIYLVLTYKEVEIPFLQLYGNDMFSVVYGFFYLAIIILISVISLFYFVFSNRKRTILFEKKYIITYVMVMFTPIIVFNLNAFIHGVIFGNTIFLILMLVATVANVTTYIIIKRKNYIRTKYSGCIKLVVTILLLFLSSFVSAISTFCIWSMIYYLCHIFWRAHKENKLVENEWEERNLQKSINEYIPYILIIVTTIVLGIPISLI